MCVYLYETDTFSETVGIGCNGSMTPVIPLSNKMFRVQLILRTITGTGIAILTETKKRCQ
jgi:hypothetical protein